MEKISSKLIYNLITNLKLNTTLVGIQVRPSGKFYKQKLLYDRESLLFQLLAVQTELERLEKGSE